VAVTSKRIPNFNTLSTLVDRLSIENVKLAHFENALEHDPLSDAQRSEFKRKVDVQHEVISGLKKELIDFMTEVFVNGNYDYVKEERTFQ